MKKKIKTLVLGSGIGGLATGAALKKAGEVDFLIFEGQDSLPLNLHNGVHYMHSINLDLPFGFDWKKIPLTEQIWWPSNKEWRDRANLQDIIEYSKKAMGVSQPNSIMSVGKTNEVWIPKSNNMNDLISSFEKYINNGNDHFVYGAWLESIDVKNNLAKFKSKDTEMEIEYETIISTVPLNKMTGICKKDSKTDFNFQTIFIRNYQLEGVSPDWFINIYIPDPVLPYYRFSVLNKTLSIESTVKYDDTPAYTGMGQKDISASGVLTVLFNFDPAKYSEYEWKTGKIVSISKDERSDYIDEFAKNNIYLLGRFGLWNRKLLMHSTIQQANEVVKYLKNGQTYESLKENLLN